MFPTEKTDPTSEELDDAHPHCQMSHSPPPLFYSSLILFIKSIIEMSMYFLCIYVARVTHCKMVNEPFLSHCVTMGDIVSVI